MKYFFAHARFPRSEIVALFPITFGLLLGRYLDIDNAESMNLFRDKSALYRKETPPEKPSWPTTICPSMESELHRENLTIFKDLCNMHKANPKLGFLLANQFDNLPKILNTGSSKEPTTLVCSTSTNELNVIEIQKNFLVDYSSEIIVPLEFAQVISDEILALKDDLFSHHCSKIKLKSFQQVLFFSKIVLSPKIYFCDGNVSEKVAANIEDVLSIHQMEVSEGCLLPLLVHGDKLSNYSDLFVQLLDAIDTPINQHLWVSVISAMFEKEEIKESDLLILSSLAKKVDVIAISSLEHILGFLEKCSPNFQKSIQFGKCLHIILVKSNLREFSNPSLDFIVYNHKSSMKKAIEIQYKKATGKP